MIPAQFVEILEFYQVLLAVTRIYCVVVVCVFVCVV